MEALINATIYMRIEKRVELLIVEETFAHAGRECSNCHYLDAVAPGPDPIWTDRALLRYG